MFAFQPAAMVLSDKSGTSVASQVIHIAGGRPSGERQPKISTRDFIFLSSVFVWFQFCVTLRVTIGAAGIDRRNENVWNTQAERNAPEPEREVAGCLIAEEKCQLRDESRKANATSIAVSPEPTATTTN